MSDKLIRGGHRGMATKLIASIETELRSTVVDADEIEVLVQELEKKRDEILKYDRMILNSLTVDTEIENDIIESSERKMRIERCILKVKAYKMATASPPVSDPLLNKNLVIKLPQISLPEFDGDATKWLSFWDSFESAVHQRKDLSGANKFNYLRGQLRGEALKLLEGFTLTNSNYNEAILLLKETYGKSNRIILALLFKIFDLRSPNNNVAELSAFRSNYECYLRGIRALRSDVDSAGFVLAALLLRKLPLRIQDNLNRKSSSTDLWELDSFRKALNDEIDFIASVEIKSKNQVKLQDNDHSGSSSDTNNKNTVSTAGNFSVTSNSVYPKKQKFKKYHYSPVCSYCFDSHISAKCDKYDNRNQRIERANELNLCINCLKRHPTDTCKSKYSCYTCSQKHHTSICPEKNEETSMTACVSSSKCSVALPVAVLPIVNSDSRVEINCIFDQCAQKTLMLDSTARTLNLSPVAKQKITLSGYNSKSDESYYDVVEFLVDVGSNEILMQALIVKDLPGNINVPNYGRIAQSLIIKGIKLAKTGIINDNLRNISVLVGGDFYYKFVKGIKSINGIHLIETSFGMMISGPLPIQSQYNQIECNVQDVTVLHIGSREDDESFDKQLEKIWLCDSYGEKENKVLLNNRVLTKFNESIQLKDGKYIACLPWKENHPTLPLNYQRARGIMTSQVRKLQCDPGVLTQYHNVFMSQLERDFIEIVPDNELENRLNKIHYIPHHGVKKNSKTTPLRIVFNCSSGSPSLNDCLYSGPSLVEDLVHILLRFRLHRYVATADIEKAFLMISLHPNDRDCTRFLWPKNPFDFASKILTYRFKVVLFGSTASQFLLNASIHYHLKRYNDAVSSLIKRNLYVDNLFCGFNNESDILSFYYRANQIMGEASLNLREWTSNSAQLTEVLKNNKDSNEDQSEKIKILGILWNKVSDSLSISEQKLLSSQVLTKRSIVSQISKIFDPLGFFCPIYIRCKVLLQDIWKKKISWDAPLDKEDVKKWYKIQDDLMNLHNLKIPRIITMQKQVELHGFCDASEKSLGIVVYIVDCLQSNFCFAKAKVAPIKGNTIPRLELNAAVILSKLINKVIEAYSQELEFNEIHLWTDSQIVLSWLKSKKKLESYVAKRIQTIKDENVANLIWHYVPSLDNPADLSSRGCSLDTLMSNNQWFHGPKWILHHNEWPTWKEDAKIAILIEEHRNSMMNSDKSFESIIEYSRYSNYSRVLKTMALVLRFINKLRHNNNLSSYLDIEIPTHNICVEEYALAEYFLIRNVQNDLFIDEIRCLNGKTPKKKTNLLKQLHLFLDDDILRCRGRIGYSDLDYDTKFPILIPNNHLLSKLIISYFHMKNKHSGLNDTVAFLRQRWWMPKMRQCVKKVLRACIICKRYQGKPYKTPICGHLPPERSRMTRAFEIVGVDFTGALLVRNKQSTSQVTKCYIALFTCAVSRAIHLELVENLTGDSFLNSFRRFVGRRSCPRVVYSDNATNFTLSSKMISEMLNHTNVQNFSVSNQCEWRFIPKKAPWFGGFWERLIGLTKTVIRKTLGRTMVTYEALQTLVIEIEARLNCRPLTYASGNIEDYTPITPSHLLIGSRLDVLPTLDMRGYDESFNERSTITSAQKRLMLMLQHFWSRWSNEYLVALKEHRWLAHGSIKIEVGDIVFIADEKNRLHWQLGNLGVEEMHATSYCC